VSESLKESVHAHPFGLALSPLDTSPLHPALPSTLLSALTCVAAAAVADGFCFFATKALRSGQFGRRRQRSAAAQIDTPPNRSVENNPIGRGSAQIDFSLCRIIAAPPTILPVKRLLWGEGEGVATLSRAVDGPAPLKLTTPNLRRAQKHFDLSQQKSNAHRRFTTLDELRTHLHILHCRALLLLCSNGKL